VFAVLVFSVKVSFRMIFLMVHLSLWVVHSSRHVVLDGPLNILLMWRRFTAGMALILILFPFGHHTIMVLDVGYYTITKHLYLL